MKKIVIYTLISFIFSVFASSCEDNKDNSLYYPDFTWDTGDGEEDEDPVTETSMRVATYNLQVETGTGWTNRRERVAQLIKDYDFEICGFEEASWEQRSYLGTQLASDYQILAYGRDTGNDDNKAGEMSGILYKKSRYTLLDAGRFWFSETPEIPSNGSVYGENSRIARLKKNFIFLKLTCLWLIMPENMHAKCWWMQFPIKQKTILPHFVPATLMRLLMLPK
mgnify:CR=1 FL=1